LASLVTAYAALRPRDGFSHPHQEHMKDTYIPHHLSLLENVILHPHVRRVACDDVTISRALHLYKIAFNLLGSGLKQGLY